MSTIDMNHDLSSLNGKRDHTLYQSIIASARFRTMVVVRHTCVACFLLCFLLHKSIYR